MKNNKIIAGALTGIMALCLAVPAFAADNTVNTVDASTKIPVQVSAEVTTFNVTLPTAFPTTVDKNTGDASSAGTATIKNDSPGSIKVSKIEVEKYGEWKLAAFDTDMSKEKVDSNKIGIQVFPKGGANAAAGGTALKTQDNAEEKQTLLDADGATADEWIINGKNATDGSNALTVGYDAKVSPVSTALTNAQVATIIVTVAWNK